MIRPVLGVILLVAAPAAAGDWFHNEYNELRAYHGDWLAVCAKDGDGPCRAVQTGIDPGSDAYFDRRLAVHRIDDTPDWMVTVMDRGLPAAAVTSLTFTFDGSEMVVARDAWNAGGIDAAGAADTITIRDAGVAAALMARIRADNRLTVTYAPTGEGDGSARFSLRGATDATNAIEARVLARQE